jgi:two-component system sensor kinase FixL
MERSEQPESAWAGARFRGVIETIVDGVVIIDGQGSIQFYNPACERIFGYGQGEVLGRNVKLLMPAPYHQEHDGYLAHYRRTGERRIIGIGREVVGRRKDGSTFPMDLSVGEIREAGETAFVGIIRDISERQQTQRRMAELQAELVHVARLSAMGEMASTLAHELNQPLTAVTNYVQSARHMLNAPERFGRERIAQILDKAAEQTIRAGQIIRRLREFIRKGETDRALADINQIVREASALSLVGAREQGIGVRLDLAGDLPPVLIDQVQIQQVLLNLIRNGVEALQQAADRRLTVATRRGAEGAVIVSVEDSGPGLAPEVAERLFQPFVTTKANGTGIGLSISRSIVEAHGGQLAWRPGETSGAIFEFALPAGSPGTTAGGR